MWLEVRRERQDQIQSHERPFLEGRFVLFVEATGLVLPTEAEGHNRCGTAPESHRTSLIRTKRILVANGIKAGCCLRHDTSD
jgi:hypothetical protein